jgi:hypothetical protein
VHRLPFPAPAIAAALLAASLLAAAPGRALGPPDERDRVLPCRPTIACTAELVSPGTLELEAGYIYRHAGTGDTQRSLPFLFKLTIAKWLQAQLGSNGYTVAEGSTPARYLDNANLGLKFQLLEQGKVAPALALSGAVSVPTFSGQTGYSRIYDAFFVGYASKDLGPIHADLNVGLNLWRLWAHPLPQGWTALALSADLVAPFGVMAESYVFSNAAQAAGRDGGVLFALTHAPRKWLVFDLGSDVGFYPTSRAYSVFVGMTIVPVVFWR